MVCVYVMTTKKGQSRKILSLGSQKCPHFAGKFNREPWDQEQSAARVTYLALTIHLKN